jgi:hypothetical protein
MSSVLRSFSQIPVRAKYLLATSLPTVDVGTVSQVSGFTLDAGEFINVSSVATEAHISDNDSYAIYDISAGSYYKDLGRQITVYHPDDHRHLAVFRQVQLVDGIGSEGLGGSAPEWDANIYLKVWGADGKGVVVVRTG